MAERHIGIIQGDMGAAGAETKTAILPAKPVAEKIPPAVFIKTPDMGAMQNEMGWWGYLRNLFSGSSTNTKP